MTFSESSYQQVLDERALIADLTKVSRLGMDDVESLRRFAVQVARIPDLVDRANNILPGGYYSLNPVDLEHALQSLVNILAELRSLVAEMSAPDTHLTRMGKYSDDSLCYGAYLVIGDAITRARALLTLAQRLWSAEHPEIQEPPPPDQAPEQADGWSEYFATASDPRALLPWDTLPWDSPQTVLVATDFGH